MFVHNFLCDHVVVVIIYKRRENKGEITTIERSHKKIGLYGTPINK